MAEINLGRVVGSDANVTKVNVESALGFEPADNNLIGLLASLTTEQKTNLVAAINEVNTDLGAHKADYVQLKDRIIPINILNKIPITLTNGLKIKTNIPASAGTLLALNLVGYRYNYTISEAHPVNLTIGGLMLGDGYRSEKASSVNGYKPEIKLAIEDGKLIIWLNITNFQLAFFIHSAKGISYNPLWYESWNYSDEAISVDATRVAVVPYT